jgi:hypothetical protein
VKVITGATPAKPQSTISMAVTTGFFEAACGPLNLEEAIE